MRPRPLPLTVLATLTALLTACTGPSGGNGGGPPPAPPTTSVCPQSVPPAGAGLEAQASRPFEPDFTFGPVAADWTAPHVPGEVLILGQSAGSLTTQSTGTPSALTGVTVQQIMPGLSRAVTPAGRTDADFARALQAGGLRVQPNYVYRALALPNDPGVTSGLLVNGARVTQTYLNRIKAPAAWDFLSACGKTPQSALTAVIDSGVDARHSDLTGRLLTPQTVTSGAADQDDAGHGTAVAGVIGAATNNATGMAGLTWGAQNVLSIRMLGADGKGSTTQLVQAMERAISAGARVINLSLGFEGTYGDLAMDRALNAAATQAVLIAAAGNAKTPGVPLFFPASHPSVISVGAVGASDGDLACYSAKPSADQTAVAGNFIVAPGGDCSGRPTDQILTLSPGGGYAALAGTSFAAPQVSGVASLMRAANPGLSAARTKELILQTVDRSRGLPLLDANAAIRAATR